MSDADEMEFESESGAPSSRPAVYISAVHADQKWTQRVASYLTNAEFRVRYATDVPVGQVSRVALEAMREQSAVFVLLVSQKYLDSGEIHGFEFPHIRSLVQREERRVVYVILEQCPWQNFVLLPVPRVVIVPEGNGTLSEHDDEQIKDDLRVLTQQVRRALEAGIVTQQRAGAKAEIGGKTGTPEVPVDIDSSQQKEPNASDEKRVLERNEDSDLISLQRLERFSYSRTVQDVLKQARQIASERRTSVQPVTPSTLFFAMVEIGNESETFTTPHFLSEWFSSHPERQKAYEKFREQYLEEMLRTKVRAGQMTSNVLPLIERASEIGRKTTGSPEIHARHLLAALLAASPDNWGTRVRRRLMAGGVDIPALQKDFLDFLRDDPGNYNDMDAWTPVLGEPPADAEAPDEASAQASSWITQETFDRFSEEARGILSLADEFQGQEKSGKIHTAHLLLALYGQPGSELRSLFGESQGDFISLVNPQLSARGIPEINQLPRGLERVPKVSGNARHALLLARDKANAANLPTIEVAHLLFAVLSTVGNESVRALNRRGITPDKIKLPRGPAAETQTKQQIEEEEDESIEISSISDAPAEKDALGFKPYVDAICRFLLNPNTKPPLTLSIEGEWGSGKSSFLRQLKNAVTGDGWWERFKKTSLGKRFAPKPSAKGNLDGKPPEKAVEPLTMAEVFRKRHRISVEFNPWRHDKEDSLWAAFALEFLRQVSRERFLLRRWWGNAILFVKHYSWKRGWFEAARVLIVWLIMTILIIGLPIEVIRYKPRWAEQVLASLTKRLNDAPGQTGHASSGEPAAAGEIKSTEVKKEKAGEKGPPDFDPILRMLLLVGGNAAYFAVVLTIWLKVKDIIGNPLENDLKKYLRSPDYEGRVAFVEQFHEDFKKIVDAYAGKEKVFVFIDDLDRCEVPKAAELMKAVNLLIADDPRLIFILGMDREKVAAGLAVKYEKMLPYLLPGSPVAGEEIQWKRKGGLEFGQAFLQKFIQLPFRVPEPNLENYVDFIKTVSTPSKMSAQQEMARENVAEKKAPEVIQEVKGETIGSGDTPPTKNPIETAKIAEIPSAPVPTPVQEQQRRERELQFQGDSDTIRAVALMYAKTLGTNPRRLKQFMNLFRLQAYIANEIGLFDRGQGGTPAITLEQLGKIVAISLKWPALLADFAQTPEFLGKLEELATSGTTDEATGTLKTWLSEPRMRGFLNYGIEKQREEYTLSNKSLYQLLHICPQRIRVPHAATPRA
jgi:KAP family P-loop domain/TIR domain/Clp amino terminal domain, pathogenicity island component